MDEKDKKYGLLRASLARIGGKKSLPTLKERVTQADYRIATQEQPTAQDTLVSKYAGILKPKKEKPKTEKQRFDNDIARIKRKVLSGTASKIEKDRLRELQSLGRKPSSAKKTKPKSYVQKIEHFTKKHLNIQKELDRQVPERNETGEITGYKFAVADDMAENLARQQDTYTDSINFYVDKKFLSDVSKKSKIPIGELEQIKVVGKQIVDEIMAQEIPSQYKYTPRGREYYINTILVPKLEKQFRLKERYGDEFRFEDLNYLITGKEKEK